MEKSDLPAKDRHRHLPERRCDRSILLGLLILGILYTLYLAGDLFLPIFIALLLSAVFTPVIRLLNRAKIPDGMGAIIVVAVLVASTAAGVYFLSDPTKMWINRIPRVLFEIEYKFQSLKRTIQEAQETTERLEEFTELDKDSEIEKEVKVQGPSLADQIFGEARSFLWTAAIIVVLLFFFLAYGRNTVNRLINSMPQTERQRHWLGFLPQIQQGLTRYLATIAGINLLLGVTTTAAMALLDVPNPVLWGVIAGIFNFVPYVGAATTLAMLTVVSILTFDSLLSMLLPPLVFLCLTALEGNFITPLVVGKSLRLNPIMIFVSILFWGWIWGIPGVLLAVPILAAIKIISNKVSALYPVSLLLG